MLGAKRGRAAPRAQRALARSSTVPPGRPRRARSEPQGGCRSASGQPRGIPWSHVPGSPLGAQRPPRAAPAARRPLGAASEFAACHRCCRRRRQRRGAPAAARPDCSSISSFQACRPWGRAGGGVGWVGWVGGRRLHARAAAAPPQLVARGFLGPASLPAGPRALPIAGAQAGGPQRRKGRGLAAPCGRRALPAWTRLPLCDVQPVPR